jgi:Endonuclease-reverse transcriptase
MLVVGDFNTHSSTWSPPDIPRSRWAGQLEEWASRNLLTLANNPGEVTHRGAEHEHNSVIDLAWFNEAAIQTGTFSNLQVDWEGSLGSDHAHLQIEGLPQPTADQPVENSPIGFVVDPELKDECIKNFKSSPPPLMFPSIPTTDEVEQAAVELFETIQTANENTFCRRQPFHPKAAPWWNESCAAATQQMHSTEDKPNRNIAHAQLKRTVCAAK